MNYKIIDMYKKILNNPIKFKLILLAVFCMYSFTETHAATNSFEHMTRKNYQRYYVNDKLDKDTIPVRNPSTTVVAIGLDKMNVFYIGVENPITVAAAEVESKNLFVSISSGSITGSNGKYIVRVSKPGKAIIEVSETINGEKIFLNTFSFRVKEISNPINGKIPWDMDSKVTIK